MTDLGGERAGETATEEDLRREAATASGVERLVLLTRVARLAARRGRYAEALSLLDQVDAGRRSSPHLSTAEQMVAGGWAALERGSVHLLDGDREAAQEFFEDAAVLGRESGADDVLVEALHQQAQAEPVAIFAVRLHRQALALAQSSTMPSVRGREKELRRALARGYERAGRPADAAAALDDGATTSGAFPTQD